MYNTLEVKDNFYVSKKNKSQLIDGCVNKSAVFTLAIPVYGCSSYLEDCFKSIKSALKERTDIQILISDNNNNLTSSKKIIELAHKYFDNFYAYFLTNTPLTQYQNFNRCFELCATKFLGMIHDDDLLNEDYFYFVNSFLKLDLNDVGMVSPTIPFFYGDKTNKVIKKHCSMHKISNFEIVHNGNSLTGIPSGGTIFNVEACKHYGGFNIDFTSSGDAFLGAVLFRNGYSIYKSNCVSGYYRIAQNVSLKTEICQNFIKQDWWFYYDWIESNNLLAKLYFKIFSNCVYSLNIDNKIKDFGQLNDQITIENLDFRGTYKKYTKIHPVRILWAVNTRLIRFRNKICRIKLY